MTLMFGELLPATCSQHVQVWGRSMKYQFIWTSDIPEMDIPWDTHFVLKARCCLFRRRLPVWPNWIFDFGAKSKPPVPTVFVTLYLRIDLSSLGWKQVDQFGPTPTCGTLAIRAMLTHPEVLSSNHGQSKPWRGVPKGPRLPWESIGKSCWLIRYRWNPWWCRNLLNWIRYLTQEYTHHQWSHVLYIKGTAFKRLQRWQSFGLPSSREHFSKVSLNPRNSLDAGFRPLQEPASPKMSQTVPHVSQIAHLFLLLLLLLLLLLTCRSLQTVGPSCHTARKISTNN